MWEGRRRAAQAAVSAIEALEEDMAFRRWDWTAHRVSDLSETRLLV